MNKTIWKTLCITACILLLVLTVLLIAMLTVFIAGAVPNGSMGVIGGASMPTFALLLDTLIGSPAFYVWLGVLVVAIISGIGWAKAVKKETSA